MHKHTACELGQLADHMLHPQCLQKRGFSLAGLPGEAEKPFNA